MVNQPLLIVSHGQPSDPERAEAELALLGKAAAWHLPEVAVSTATLSAPGALAQALAQLGPGGRVYPLFMAGGWFTRVHLPKRLVEAGAQGWRVLEPMGCDPAVHDLAVQIVAEAAADFGPLRSVVLAAHGSGQSAVPADIAAHVAELIAARLGVAAQAAFIDQSPRLADLRGHAAQSVCLPFFAASGGHVTGDIPAALKQAGFAGRLLPALGMDARLPKIIAAAARAGRAVCDGECRWRKAV